MNEFFFLKLELSVRQRIIRGRLMIGQLHEHSTGKYGCMNPNLEKNIQEWFLRREEERLENPFLKSKWRL